MSATVGNRNSLRFWWPMGVAGLLLPFTAVQIHRWLPLWVAVFIAFTALFSAAAAVAVRRLPPVERSYGREFVGAVVGGLTGAAVTYFFPWV